MRLTSLSIACVLVAAGCNGSSDGGEGLISFTPHTCGRVGCDFENAIAVGGRISLHIAGDSGTGTDGLDVVSSDPAAMTVIRVPDVGGRATWQLDCLAAGTLELQVIDPETQDEIDRLEVDIETVARLGLENFIGSAVGPDTSDGTVDETWTVTADQPVSFRLTPFADDDIPLMGLFNYQVSIDQELADGLIDSDISEGRLYFRVVAGEWTASWDDSSGTFVAKIIAQ